jgi:hypothetical protein
MNRLISILVTWDIDPFPDVNVEAKKAALRQTRQLLHDQQILSTFFLPAKMAEALNGEIQQLLHDGHEIGCHGLTHGDEEDFSRMSAGTQRTHICGATEILQRVTGQAIASFRGPRMKTSHVTQCVLEELGYVADCSVASQRVDFLSSNLVNVNWILAPRLPYRPSHRSAFLCQHAFCHSSRAPSMCSGRGSCGGCSGFSIAKLVVQESQLSISSTLLNLHRPRSDINRRTCPSYRRSAHMASWSERGSMRRIILKGSR